MNNRWKNLLFIAFIVVLAILSVFTICIKINNGKLLISDSNDILYICIFSLCLYSYPKIIKLNNKRKNTVVIIMSILFCAFQTIGIWLQTPQKLSTNWYKLLLFLGYGVIFYMVISLIYEFIDKKIIGNCEINDNKISIKYFFCIWIIIFVMYVPYFLACYPGVLSPDSMDQLGQALGKVPLTNHHPVMHTLIIRLFVKIGVALNNITFGVSLYSLFQMIALSAIFAYSIYYMKTRGVNKIIIITSVIFYAFYPVNGIYSVTMWKDILFSAIILLLTISLTEIVKNSKTFFSNIINCIKMSIVILIAMLFRNNGLYVVLILGLLMLMTYRKYFKKILYIFLIPISIYYIFTGPIFSALSIKSSSIVEALSIPLQQFARVTLNCSETLSDEEKEMIHNFIPVENLGNLYNPVLSDPVKNNADKHYVQENKGKLVKLYFKLMFKYPTETIKSFAYNNYGYWFPEATNWVAMMGIDSNNGDFFGISSKPKMNTTTVNKIVSFINYRDIPVFSMLFSIGLAVWIGCIILGYCIYVKKYNIIIVFIPVIALWLTNLASPVWCEFRYMYSLFICLPIIVANINVIKLKKEEV